MRWADLVHGSKSHSKEYICAIRYLGSHLRGGGARMNLQMAAGSCIRRSGRYGVPNDFRRERSKRSRQPFRKSGHDSFAECRRERS